MMELTKLQCTSCGGALEIKPGIDRVKCQFCGMNYLIERKETEKSAGGSKADGDNPIDVNFVLIPTNTISFDTELETFHVPRKIRLKKDIDFSYLRDHLKGDGILADPDYINQRDSTLNLVSARLYLFACISYATKETFDIEIGKVSLEPVYLYYTGKDDKHFSDESYYAEPDVIYEERAIWDVNPDGGWR